MLGIVIVDYKSAQRTIDYIKSQLIDLNLPHKIVVVNNSATEESNQVLATQLDAQIIDFAKPFIVDNSKSIYILPDKDNLGFAKGNNKGADFLIENFKVDKLLFSNNDLIISDKSTISSLIKTLDSNPRIGMIGPEIVGLDGKRQSPEPYIGIWSRYVLPDLLSPFISKKYKLSKFKFDYSKNAQDGFHYKIMGAFFMMKSRDFIDCGKMDPNTFLFAEEMILSERLAKIGKKPYFQPTNRIIHAHGQTVKSHISRLRSQMLQFDSDAYYFHTYRDVNTITIGICRVVYNIICKLKNKK